MKWSIQTRLTLWYGASLAVALTLLGFGVWWVLETSLFRDVDQRLQDHVTETGRIVAQEVSEHHRRGATEEIRESLSASPGELSAVCDAQAAMLYKSPELNFDCGQRGGGFGNIRIHNEPFRSLLSREGPYVVFAATSTRHIHSTLERLRWILLLSAPLVLLVAMAGGYWLSLRAMAPIEEISRTARTIGLQNLSRRLPVPETGDALERLSETLNEMFARLETAFQRISQFTADAAHELRTPLALIRTTAEVALRSGDAEEYKEALPQIVEETARTALLVENLLFLARADSGATLQSRAAFRMDKVVQQAMEAATKLASAHHIDLTLSGELPAWEIEGDSVAMRRLLLILLDNAIKYTAEGGRVTVRGSGSTLEIEDTGIGISADDLPHIFERFYRADKARSRDAGGTGLGLSLAKWIAEAHGGSITAESSPGAGSKFHLVLSQRP